MPSGPQTVPNAAGYEPSQADGRRVVTKLAAVLDPCSGRRFGVLEIRAQASVQKILLHQAPDGRVDLSWVIGKSHRPQLQSSTPPQKALENLLGEDGETPAGSKEDSSGRGTQNLQAS